MNKAPTRSSRFTDLAADKLRGGYYTDDLLADWLCAWAQRASKDSVLEPSCGGGAFVAAALRRRAALARSGRSRLGQIIGVEITPGEAKAARARIAAAGNAADGDAIVTEDFFAWRTANSRARFDAVVGNPPFIRYQSFPEPHRSRAMEAMRELGLRPNKLTNSWVPFVVAATAVLKPGGRLALVLPAELLQVTYAGQLRSFLTERFARIDIIACNELFFANAEQEVVLLLADGALSAPSLETECEVAMSEVQTVDALLATAPGDLIARAQPKTVRHDSEKWLKFLLDPIEIELMRELRSSSAVTTLGTHAEVNVGVVTGKNEFFVLNHSQVTENGLTGLTIPLVSRSAHLRGARLGRDDWDLLAAADDRVHLLDMAGRPGRTSAGLKRYVADGERREVHLGYKCSIRSPWYAVPSIWTPDAFVFRQIYDFPRIVLNEAGATSTDTIHRLRAKGESPERVVANTYTWLTAASAEIEGRSYGGGVLELEPNEAERLLMPGKLNGAVPMAECDRLTRAGKLSTVLEENARIVLRGHLGLSARDTKALRGIYEKMRDRRLNRRRRGSAASTGAA